MGLLEFFADFYRGTLRILEDDLDAMTGPVRTPRDDAAKDRLDRVEKEEGEEEREAAVATTQRAENPLVDDNDPRAEAAGVGGEDDGEEDRLEASVAPAAGPCLDPRKEPESYPAAAAGIAPASSGVSHTSAKRPRSVLESDEELSDSDGEDDPDERPAVKRTRTFDPLETIDFHIRGPAGRCLTPANDASGRPRFRVNYDTSYTISFRTSVPSTDVALEPVIECISTHRRRTTAGRPSVELRHLAEGGRVSSCVKGVGGVDGGARPCVELQGATPSRRPSSPGCDARPETVLLLRMSVAKDPSRPYDLHARPHAVWRLSLRLAPKYALEVDLSAWPTA